MAPVLIETPAYLPRVDMPTAGKPPLPRYFTWSGRPGIAPRLHQMRNECWVIAALQMTQDRAVIAGIQNTALAAMTPEQLERRSIAALASHYDKLHGLAPGTVASRHEGGILAMALDYLELAGHAQPESAAVLRGPTAANIKRSVMDEGPVAITYDGDGAGEIHSACVVGWDDDAQTWLLRNSWGPTTETLPQSATLVAFVITPRGDVGVTTTPFSGARNSGWRVGRRRGRRRESVWRLRSAQCCSVWELVFSSGTRTRSSNATKLQSFASRCASRNIGNCQMVKSLGANHE